MSPPTIASQITFFYYRDLAPAQDFYKRIMGLQQVEDQGWAKIYQVSASSFVGIVDERHGSLRVQPNSAVMLTLVVDDVPGWYAYLQQQGVEIVREYGRSPEINIEYFFIKDPGGYIIELQKFLKPELQAIFGLTSP